MSYFSFTWDSKLELPCTQELLFSKKCSHHNNDLLCDLLMFSFLGTSALKCTLNYVIENVSLRLRLGLKTRAPVHTGAAFSIACSRNNDLLCDLLLLSFLGTFALKFVLNFVIEMSYFGFAWGSKLELHTQESIILYKVRTYKDSNMHFHPE
jgi:hypothetical protein